MKYLIACTLVVIAGCGLHQNPLSGQDARLQDGVSVPTKPVYDKPIDSQSVRIAAPDFAALDEGKTFEALITARVLVADYVVTVKIENLTEFPGATFDPGTGKFSWTPPKGFVASVGATGALERNLVIRATALKADGPVLFATREMRFRIGAEGIGPKITLVYRDANEMREGSTALVTIRIEDMEATENDDTTWPEILFDGATSRNGLAPYMQLQSRSRWAPHTFNYYYRLDLVGADVTHSVTDTVTSFFALNKRNQRSATERLTLTVLNDFVAPSTTWTRPLAFRAGERKVYTFMVYDPRGDMALGYDSTRDLPFAARLDCRNDGVASTLECTIDWTPAAADAGTQSSLTLKVAVRNPDPRDAQSAYRNLYFTYRVDPSFTEGGHP